MLEAIRKRSASFVVKLLFLLLVLSFGLWGIGDVFSPSRQDDWVAKIDDVIVTPQVLNSDYQNALRRLRQVLGENVDSDQARALGLPERTLENIVNRTLLDLGARDLGVVVSDDIVRQIVQTNPAFRNQQSMFDKSVFDQALRNAGISEAHYLATLRGDLVRRQLVGSALVAGIVARPLVDGIYRHRNEKRIIEYLRIENRKMAQFADADEGQLRNFHKGNSSLFTAPEYRSVTAILLSPSHLAEEMSISAEELDSAYHDRADEFNEPERRTLEQIVFRSKEVGQRAYKRITAGSDFVTVAKEEAGLDRDAIQLGTVSREQILPEIADATFDLPEGGISELIESPLGWHLIRVTSIRPARQQSFEEVKDQLRKNLARDKADNALVDLSNRLEDALGRGANLEEAAAEVNAVLRHIDVLDRNGLDKKGEQVPDLPAGFVDTIFATGEDTISPLTEAGGYGGYFVVRVDKVMPSSVRDFETVREEVERAWTDAKRAELAESSAKALVEEIKQGTKFSAAAAKYGQNVITTSPIARSGEGAAEELPKILIDLAFQTEPGSSFTARGQDASFVARVKTVISAEPASDPQRFVALEEGLASTENNALLSQLTKALALHHPIQINNQALEQLF